MGERRLFSTKITESDAFLDMGLASQALYFHLCLNADDDGVVDCPRKIMRMVNAQPDDMNVLIAKRFVLQLSQSVVVIKHWLINNTLQKDRYKTTQYGELMSALYIKENGAYTDDPATGDTRWNPKFGKPLNTQNHDGNGLETDWKQNGIISQVKSSKVKLIKNNQSSIIDVLTDEEYEKLSNHVTDMMALLNRVETVNAQTIKNPYGYLVAVANSLGIYKEV